MKALLFALTVGMSLACGGAGMSALNGLTGLDMEMRMGADAKPPADFPVPPPASATPVMYMAMTGDSTNLNLPDGVTLTPGEYRMELMTYAEVDSAAEVALNVQTLEADGWSAVKMKSDASGVATFKKGDLLFVTISGKDNGDDSLVHGRFSPKKSPTAPPAAIP